MAAEHFIKMTSASKILKRIYILLALSTIAACSSSDDTTGGENPSEDVALIDGADTENQTPVSDVDPVSESLSLIHI